MNAHKQRTAGWAADPHQRSIVGQRVRVVEWKRGYGARKARLSLRATYEGIIRAVHLAEGIFLIERDGDRELRPVRLDCAELTLLDSQGDQ
jgi:hypothetical protein